MARNNTNDDFDKPEYLASINEATITPTLRDQARALGNHPVKIFEFVRNTIEWQPTWGGQQTAEMTLDVKRGNAQDISTLLIALLRAANIPARYVHGTVDVPAEKFQNMVGNFDSLNAAMIFAASAGLPSTGVVRGGRIEAVRMDHVWVEAAVDFYPSRGVKNIEPDSWMSLDASHKQYEYLQGLDAAMITQLDGDALANQFVQSGIVNEAEGWVQGLDATIIESAQHTAQQKLEQHIENMTDPTVGEVIGGRKIIEKRIEVLPTGMPYEHVVRGQRYANLPASLQVQVQLGLGYDQFTGDYAQRVNKPLYELNQRHLTISFKPASKADEDALAAMTPANVTDVSQLPSVLPASIRVIPEIKRGDEVLASGSVMALGEEVRVGYQISYAGYAYFVRHYDVIAGSYLGLGVVGTNMSTKTFNQLKADLGKNQNILQSQDKDKIKTLTREEVFGDIFVSGIQSYYAEYSNQARLMAQVYSAEYLPMPIIGTFGYEPHQRTFFGLNRGIETHGMYMNVYVANVVQDTNGIKNKTIQFNQSLGALSSILEHRVPERLFSHLNNNQDSFSAIKALKQASINNQKIYKITNINQNTVLSKIIIDSSSFLEISAAIAAGKEIFIHENPLIINGYKGSGYVIFDPETGAGIYKISGGKNGGFFMIAMSYRADYGVMAWDTIRVDRLNQESTTGYTEAMRNAEHYLYAYQKVCDEGNSRAFMAALTEGYFIWKSLVYGANSVGAKENLGLPNYLGSPPTLEQLAAGLMGARDGANCTLGN